MAALTSRRPTKPPGKKKRQRPSARRPGRPRSEERAPGETRARLIEAATDAFASHGYAGASIQAIAQRADVTTGTIYRHFESKADLLLAVVDQAVHGVPLSEGLGSRSEPSVAPFARLVSIYAEPTLRRVRRLAIEIHAAASRDPNAAALLERFNRRIHRDICSRLEESVAEGTLSATLDIPKTASLLLVMVMGMSHLDTLEPDLLGDRRWTSFIEVAIEHLLTDGAREIGE